MATCCRIAKLVRRYKKQDSGGPVALIDRLKNDLKMEMKEDDMEEEQAQKDYEETMAQSAKKRAQDSKTIVEKEQQMAEAEGLLQKAQFNNSGTEMTEIKHTCPKKNSNPSIDPKR